MIRKFQLQNHGMKEPIKNWLAIFGVKIAMLMLEVFLLTNIVIPDHMKGGQPMEKVVCDNPKCLYQWIARVEEPKKCPLCGKYRIKKEKKGDNPQDIEIGDKVKVRLQGVKNKWQIYTVEKIELRGTMLCAVFNNKLGYIGLGGDGIKKI